MSVTFCKGEESRRKVLDAAFALFTEQGYEKTTMRQIIQKSGVLNGSVYHAFGNKDGVFEVVFNRILDKAL
ncbi:MAG: TetR/AcrR family transcriptional regulator [archaeon]|nr:TetR/AcrR family transcriptional regulator [archaeon]